jgi:hypothetical protein
MLFSNFSFIGLDPTAGEKPIAYAAIDQHKHLLALGAGSMDEVLAFCGGQHQAVVSICGPRRPNLGLMNQPEFRDQLNPPPAPGRWENFRVADYYLRQHHIFIPPTMSEEQKCSNWMRQSFQLFRRLAEMGYQDIASEAADRCLIEIYPHACYSALLGRLPFSKNSLEGRIQRQLILVEQEIDVADPMGFFEEITRHRILKGMLPYELLCTPGELDALIAAFTAWFAARHPTQITQLGDPIEGQVTLPISTLKNSY